MGTQALISILRNGETYIKIVCGCNGYNAKKFVGIIKHKKFENIYDIYNMALSHKFGCKDCLVVMDKDEIVSCDEDFDFSLYRETFYNPLFNPRWRYGTVDYSIIIKFENLEVSKYDEKH